MCPVSIGGDRKFNVCHYFFGWEWQSAWWLRVHVSLFIDRACFLIGLGCWLSWMALNFSTWWEESRGPRKATDSESEHSLIFDGHSFSIDKEGFSFPGHIICHVIKLSYVNFVWVLPLWDEVLRSVLTSKGKWNLWSCGNHPQRIDKIYLAVCCI